MQLLINDTDLNRLKPETRLDLITTLLGSGAPVVPDTVPGMMWDNVVDFSPEEVVEFMRGAQEKTRDGLKIFAQHGPIILANKLDDAGITNYGHFQGRVTQRTRTIKKSKKKVWLFGWDDWTAGANAKRGYGHYGVTEATYRSLRAYFQLG